MENWNHMYTFLCENFEECSNLSSNYELLPRRIWSALPNWKTAEIDCFTFFLMQKIVTTECWQSLNVMYYY